MQSVQSAKYCDIFGGKKNGLHSNLKNKPGKKNFRNSKYTGGGSNRHFPINIIFQFSMTNCLYPRISKLTFLLELLLYNERNSVEAQLEWNHLTNQTSRSYLLNGLMAFKRLAGIITNQLFLLNMMNLLAYIKDWIRRWILFDFLVPSP